MTLNLIHRVLGRITAVTMVFSIDLVSSLLIILFFFSSEKKVR